MRRLLATLSLFFAAFSIPFSAAPALANAQIIAPAPSVSCGAFSRNLTMGMTGMDVKALQQFLNTRGFSIAASGAGSAGLETTVFGAKTKAALAKFQAVNGIVPAAGYFGVLTRAKALILCAGTVSAPAAPATTAVPSAGSAGTGSGNGVAFTPVLTPDPAPVITPPPAAIVPTAASINPQSIVGVLCTYNYNGAITLMKGSGVIVSPQGYVLTARHIIDPRWTLQSYADSLTPSQKELYANATLSHCEIGLPENATLPSANDIRSMNPQFLITQHFQYEAVPVFVPSQNGLSTMEYETADVAVLRITNAAADCFSYNHNCSDFGAFPYASVATGAMPSQGSDEIVSYGYPAEPGFNDENGNFSAFYLKGAVGTVGYYTTGDSRFAGKTLNFAFEAQDIQTGRSGSPLFYQGRVVGILYGSTSGSESYNLSMPAIMALLSDAGQNSFLATQ
jgi:peptidoglycan hydrolase-like protein with peptidoglycan-binding domain